jgi:uncharacterized repeat protein (TIGR03803 family)
VLYSFTGGDDGGYAEGLTLGAGGALYGVTLIGGTSDAGTVFELQPARTAGGAWAETVLHAFSGGVDGSYPDAPPVIASGGSLYGSTTGTVDPGGYQGVAGVRTVFQLAPSARGGANWSKTLLAEFGYGNLQATPCSLIVRGGPIYGAAATPSGGEFFELQKPAAPGGPWTKIVLHAFTDGNTPTGSLVADEAGAIYGVTIGVSEINPPPGTVYRIRP